MVPRDWLHLGVEAEALVGNGCRQATSRLLRLLPLFEALHLVLQRLDVDEEGFDGPVEPFIGRLADNRLAAAKVRRLASSARRWAILDVGKLRSRRDCAAAERRPSSSPFRWCVFETCAWASCRANQSTWPFFLASSMMRLHGFGLLLKIDNVLWRTVSATFWLMRLAKSSRVARQLGKGWRN